MESVSDTFYVSHLLRLTDDEHSEMSLCETLSLSLLADADLKFTSRADVAAFLINKFSSGLSVFCSAASSGLLKTQTGFSLSRLR